MAETKEVGANKPLKISLPDCYFDILESMAHLQGRDIEDLAKERLMQILIEDIVHDDGYYGELICKGWQDDLKDDKYYQEVAGN
jgi:hypothetical protein